MSENELFDKSERWLTEAEMKEIVEAWDSEDVTHFISLGRGHWEDIALLIAKAQDAKSFQTGRQSVIEWLNHACEHHPDNEMPNKKRARCWQCWQQLLNEVVK